MVERRSLTHGSFMIIEGTIIHPFQTLQFAVNWLGFVAHCFQEVKVLGHISLVIYIAKKKTVEVLTFEPLILLCLGLSKVFENTAMFGDLVLRLPDIVHSIYDKNKDWQLLLGWCYWFCKESGVFDETNGKLLHLVCFIIICLTVKFCTFCFKDAIFDRRALNLFEEKQSQITPSCVW